jgi:hypothetical protein
VDLDDCFQEEGTLKPWARDVVFCLDSYTEYSPSGKGLHVLVRGTIPHSIKDGNGFEMYNELRYFTVTGNHLPKRRGPPLRSDKKNLTPYSSPLAATSTTPHRCPMYGRHPIRKSPLRKWSRCYHSFPYTVTTTHTGCLSSWPYMTLFPDETGVRLIESWSPGYKGEVRRKFRSFDRTAKAVSASQPCFTSQSSIMYPSPASRKNNTNPRGVKWQKKPPIS